MMHSPDCQPACVRPGIPDVLRIAVVIAGIYAIWGAGTALVRLSGGLFPAGEIVPLGELFSIFLHIVLASICTVVFLVHAEPLIKERHRTRIGFICGSICIAIFCFLYVRETAPDQVKAVYILNSANLVVFAILIGTWIVSPLKRPPELVPVSAAMVFADLFSVFKGPTGQIAESIKNYYSAGMAGPPPLADFILLKITVPGSGHMPPIFGVSDWIVVAFFSSAALRFGFQDNLVGRPVGRMVTCSRPGFYLPVAALGLFTAVFLAGHLGMFLPALPIIALFSTGYILVRYPSARRLTTSDWILTISVILILVCSMLVYNLL